MGDGFDGMDASQRVAVVQQQSMQADEANRDEAIAEVSHDASMGVGLGMAAEGGPVSLLAFGAAISSAWAGSKLAQAVNMDEHMVHGLEMLGMHRVGAGGDKAATIDDQVAHTHGFLGFLAALAVGAAAAIGAGLLIAATGGAAAVVIIGAAAAGGFSAGFIGGPLNSALSQTGSDTGPIISGSPNVFIHGKPVARMTDKVNCSKESKPAYLIEGCADIFVNGLPMVRVGHKVNCGAKVDQGWEDVILSKTVAACGVAAPDVPLWASIAADWVFFLPLGKGAAMATRSLRAESEALEGENAIINRRCPTDPVDVATGEFVDWRTDVFVSGVLPLALRRTYSSNHTGPAESLFGARWSDSFSVCLVRKGSAIQYWDDEGVGLVFDAPYAQLNSSHRSAPNLLLQGTQESPILLDQSNGAKRYFAWQRQSQTARLARIEDGQGNHWRFIYEEERLVRIEHSHGHHLELRWREPDELAEAAGIRSLSAIWLNQPDRAPVELVRYEFDPLGRLTNSQSQSSGKLYYRYDSADRITHWGDATHTHVQVKYQVDGRVAEVITPGGIHSGRFQYDLAKRQTTVWIGGQATRYDYNEHNLVTGTVNPLGQSTHATWDRCRRKTSETDEHGGVTRYEYDAAGRLRTVTDPRARRTVLQYDDSTRLVALTRPDGRKQRWQYDAAGNVVSSTAADGTVKRDAYDEHGRLAKTVAPDGRVTRYEYDPTGNPCGSVAPNGARWQWKQDLLGRITEITDPAQEKTRYHYTPLQAPWAGAHTAPQTVLLPTGERIGYQYNQEGLVERVTDAAGSVWQYAWGAYDLLSSVTDPKGNVTFYGYDVEARLSTITNARGEVWRFIYDAAGRLVQETDFTQRTTRYRYDSAGRLIKKTVADFLETDYLWDLSERLAEIRSGEWRIVYEYDQQDRLQRAARLQGERGESELRWQYDQQGRVTHAWQDGREIRWEYDPAGRCTARQTPVGRSNHGYDVLGLLNNLHTPQGDIFIGRDLLGRETERGSVPLPPALPGMLAPPTPPNPHFRLQQEYDAIGRLLVQSAPGTSGTGAPLRRYRWEQGRLAGIDDRRFGNVRYTTDERNQIVRADYRLGQGAGSRPMGVERESFAYDALGNIVDRNTSAPYEFHARARVTHSYSQGKVTQQGNVHYRYDPAGRLVERTEHRNGFRPQTWEFVWDGFDRMIGARTPAGDLWRYTYDAFGRRTGKRRIRSGQSRPRPGAVQQESYLWDGPTVAVQWKIYADDGSTIPTQVNSTANEVSHTETLAWHYHPGTFTPLAVSYQRNDSEPELLHIVADHLGTPREAIKSDGEVVWAAQLQTWGLINQKWSRGGSDSPSDGSIKLDLRLPNQWEDQETGLFYNFHRYYDPATGQYVSSDPIGLEGGLRSHSYVRNPLSRIDPLGLAVCPIQKLEDRGFTGVTRNERGGLDYSKSNALYSNPGRLKPNGSPVEPIVKIRYTGDYQQDFEAASQAGFGQKSTPSLDGESYVWHHLDDYNPETNEGTMQLVKSSAHNGIPHTGGVSQYQAATGNQYTFGGW